jgi:hypothetical protein
LTEKVERPEASLTCVPPSVTSKAFTVGTCRSVHASWASIRSVVLWGSGPAFGPVSVTCATPLCVTVTDSAADSPGGRKLRAT